MSDYTKLEDARVEVAELVINSGILGLARNYYGGLNNKKHLANRGQQLLDEARHNYLGGHQNFGWEQAWGVSCDLSIDWKTETTVKSGKKVQLSYPHCKVSWSSTGRDAVSARAAVLLYSAVIDLAMVIETHFRSREVESNDAAFERYQAAAKAKEAKPKKKPSKKKKTA